MESLLANLSNNGQLIGAALRGSLTPEGSYSWFSFSSTAVTDEQLWRHRGVRSQQLQMGRDPLKDVRGGRAEAQDGPRPRRDLCPAGVLHHVQWDVPCSRRF
jgi:hypothetical protein